MAVGFAKFRRCRSTNLQKPEIPTQDSIVTCLDCGAGEKWADLERRMAADVKQTISKGTRAERVPDKK